jgi:Ni/Fe-hydrogenase subunit HybB-like protein
MEAITGPLLWVAALSAGISILFVVGARRLVYRLSGQSGIAATYDNVSPVLRLVSQGRVLRVSFVVAALGVGAGIVLLRFVFGIGAVTNLSDQFPLGMWIGFDVMSGVALAAGAFVMASIVHVLGFKRFEPLVRPAILTGFLGYLLAVMALVVDLGRPYNVWRPLVHWQHRSALWEVGVCVATYTTVLFIEFLPVILERLNVSEAITSRLPTVPLYRLLKKVSMVFIVLGVVLSTMHQSSLGSLWVLLPGKLSPLWYSLYLPVFFWLSAIAVGLTMTIVEATLSSKAFKRELELDLLADLAKAASVVLFIYLLARGVDLVHRDAWSLLFEPNLQAAAFWVEMGLGIAVPAVLFAVRPLRYRPNVLLGGSLLVVCFGIVLNRLNVSVIGLLPYTGAIYTPSLMEIALPISLITLGVTAFGLAARYLPVFVEEHAVAAVSGQAHQPVLAEEEGR